MTSTTSRTTSKSSTLRAAFAATSAATSTPPPGVVGVNNRHDDLATMLRRLNLSHIAETFTNTALKASKANLSHEAFLYELAAQECAFRSQRRIERHLRESRLPREKTFATLQLDRFGPALQLQIERLRTGAFVEDAVNIVAVGRPGVGKSHVAAALGHELILLGHTVLWTSTAALVQRLLAAKRDLRLPQQLAKLDHVACLILDDIGYVQHDRDEMEVLFTLLAERYERRSVILTTNLVFSEWDRIFKDPMTTLAAIDRVVHHSVILDLMAVDSYRAQEAKEAQDQQVSPSLHQPTESDDVVVATGTSN
jgi:DNA replication protein DnaC